MLVVVLPLLIVMVVPYEWCQLQPFRDLEIVPSFFAKILEEIRINDNLALTLCVRSFLIDGVHQRIRLRICHPANRMIETTVKMLSHHHRKP